MALFLALALTPSAASAVETRLPLGFSPITGSGSGVTIEAPSGLAVDEASGNVFLDDGRANNVVDILGAEGGAPAGLAPPFQITGFAFYGEPSGAAIDNSATSPSKGTLYVTDVANQRLKKFTRNAVAEQYEAAGELTTSSGPALGEVLGVAVDAAGNVFVADYGSSSVIEFSPTGVQLARIDTSAGVGNPSAVAVDSAGDLFVQGYGSTAVVKYPVNVSGEIESAVFTPIVSGSTGIAVDAGTNRLYVALGDHVNQYSTASLAFQGSFGANLSIRTARVAVNSATGRIYVSNAAAANVVVFGPPTIVPGATVDAATNLTPTKATLSGSVNPDNVAVTDCEFEYLTEAEYEENGNSYAGVNAPLTKVCEGPIPTDSSDHPVTVALTGLSGGTTYHFRLSASNVNGTNHSADETFSSSEAAVTRDATANSGTKATLNGAVFPDNIAVTECKFEYGTTTAYGSSIPCEEAVPTDEGEHPVTAGLTNLQPNGTTYHFRLVIVNGNGTAHGADKSFTTPDTVVTGAASNIAAQAATVNGTIKTDGLPLTECKFEYGLTAAYGASEDCEPPFGSIPSDSAFHPVSADLGGLDVNSTYHFRLVAANANGPISGGDESFTTSGPPQIVEEVATNVDKTTATLQAKIDPSGFATTYYFEWGSDASYGNRVPLAEDPAIGSASAPVTVTASLSGLDPATVYHFRVVATNDSGTTVGGDRRLRTLGVNGLPADRGIELVSPPDKRPVGGVNKVLVASNQSVYQVAEDGEAVGYPILQGLESSDSGGETIFAGQRSGGGNWSSTQVTPASLIPAPEAGLVNARSGAVRYLSPDLGCAVIESPNPLTADTPEVDVENGVYNLYRWDRATDTYTLITNRVPIDPTKWSTVSIYYNVAGSTDDCSRIFFKNAEYSFSVGESGLYEWDEGTLRDAGLRPDGSVASGINPINVGFEKNVVSSNGRLFFVANSNAGDDAGKPAIFVRKSPTEVVDATHSATSVAPTGAKYETASPDGSSVFFLANYGLAATSSAGPTTENCLNSLKVIDERACDLYRFDADSEELVDVSADPNPADTGGAMAQGVLAVSRDGSVVYFAARGQLVPGKGRTFAQNQAGTGFANVYRWEGGDLSYAGSLTAEGISNTNRQTALIHEPKSWNSQTTDSGDYLLYVSRDNITGTNPAEVPQAYLYTASRDSLDCISCPPSGAQPVGAGPLGPAGERAMVEFQIPSSGFAAPYTPRSLSEDGRAIFTSEDALAPGAIAGKGSHSSVGENSEKNIYEWYDGQVSLLAHGKVQMRGLGGPDGRDVFIQAFGQLNWEDKDFAPDLYDFRVGGGHAEPPPPPQPCNAVAGECQGQATPPPASTPPPSAGFNGPGDPPVAQKKKPHKKKRHKKKNGKKAKNGKQAKKGKRAANSNRGGVK